MQSLLLAATLLVPQANATCPSDVAIQGALTCSSEFAGQVTATDPSYLGGACEDYECYTCGDPYANEPQYAPEAVYTFSCQKEGSVHMKVTDLTCDMDIYILDSSCNPNTGCLHGSTAPYDVDDKVKFDCVPGETYYVVVEAYGTNHLDVASGPCIDENENVFDPTYTLSFDVSDSTGCAEDCDDSEDNDLDGLTDCDDSDCLNEATCCDLDGDGFFSEALCGGNDCNDGDASIHPTATDIPGDGIDQDCDGADAEPVDTAPPEETGDTEPEPQDTGPTDTGTPKEGTCGCAASGNGGSVIGLGALALMAVSRRRRRG